MSVDFLCERLLKERNAELHGRYRNSVFAIDRLLANYKAVFPFFTNHTFEHSEQVINYCNMIIGEENAARLNADELYILLMGACLHDVGMGISERDFMAMKDAIPGVNKYINEHPEASVGDVTRAFHQEFAAKFIEKYRDLFEIPSDEHLYCICQIARGHRKLDLLDTDEFDPHYRLPGGAEVRLPYLAAAVRLADEMDLTADRNLLCDYTQEASRWPKENVLYLKCHQATKNLRAEGGALILTYEETGDPEVHAELLNISRKLEKTFGEFASVVQQRTDFTLVQTHVSFEWIS